MAESQQPQQAQQPHHQRPYTMEPSHITEFGSPRYIDKIAHHDGSQMQIDSLDATIADSHAQPSSRFILPLRDAKIGDAETVKPREKKSFFNLRQKVSHLHSRPSHVDPTFAVPHRTSTESTRRTYVASAFFSIASTNFDSVPLDQLFHALPNELQIQVVSYLPLNDVLNLRLASKSWHTLISFNEAPIVRHHLDQHIPAYATRLFPITTTNELNFHYLCGLWHRLHVATKLSFLMCEWITKDIFLRTTEAQRLAFAPQTERMRRRLIPLLFTIFHFFETYRKLHIEYIKEHGHGLKQEAYTLNPIEQKIMGMYDDKTLLRVHEVFPLVISSFCRRLRPPTYVGRVERSLRGYVREKPSDDVHVAILCLGGLRQVERLWEIKGYNTRRGAVDTWFHGLTKEEPPEPPTKTRRSLMSFGRKKSSAGDRDPRRPSFSDAHFRSRSPTGSIDATNMGFDPAWIFNSSLSAGVPMGSLTREEAQGLLSDLPVLQHIWTMTAETLVLKRGIVGRPQDIKRNQQVMLDLIREDGIDEEDEWWYGRNAPESVRPPLGANDDDAE